MKTKDILDGFINKKVLVVGDLMIDHKINGKAKRMSPEAPVPLLNITSEEFELGGASNVAKNVVSLGAKVSIAGVIGRDKYAIIQKRLLDKHGINAILASDREKTTLKTRYFSGNHYMFRTDIEDIKEIGRETQNNLMMEIGKQEFDIIIISDYGKGVVTESFIDSLKALNIKIIMDPKPKKIEHYKNIDYITPNVEELGQIAKHYGLLDTTSNHNKYIEKALFFLKEKIPVNIIVTRSEKGISFLETDKLINVSAINGEVYDVTGAGDSAVAAIALTLCTTNDLFAACKIGVSAGCSAVRHPGTVTVTKQKILDEIKNANYKTRL